MNAASPDQPQVRKPELSTTEKSSRSGRWLLLGIMTVLLLWGLYLARGAFLYRENLLQGGLVLSCVLAFLGFWGILLLTRNARPAAKEITGGDQLSKACISAFSFSLIGFLLTFIALLLVPKSVFSDRLTYISLLLNPLGLLLAIIGLSNPRRAAGKQLGLWTFPVTLAWIVVIVLYVAA